MTKLEALSAMKIGLKITHRYFSPEEWMMSKGTFFVFDDGEEIEKSAFWADRSTIDWHDGYSVWKEAK